MAVMDVCLSRKKSAILFQGWTLLGRAMLPQDWQKLSDDKGSGSQIWGG